MVKHGKTSATNFTNFPNYFLPIREIRGKNLFRHQEFLPLYYPIINYFHGWRLPRMQRLNREIFRRHVPPRGVGVEEGVEGEGGAPELVILKAAGVPQEFGGEVYSFGGEEVFGELAVFGGGGGKVDARVLGVARVAAVEDGLAH